MILYFRITADQKRALLFRYPDVRKFVERIISDTADKIIIERGQFDIDKELWEYHNRQILTGSGPHRKRIVTQATRDKISKSLKATSEKQGWKGMKLLEETRLKMIGRIVSKETREAISKHNKGKIRSEEQRGNISLGKTGQKYKKRVLP